MNVTARRSVRVLLVVCLAITGAAAQQPTAGESRFTGRWEGEGVPSSPWVFDLVSAGPNKIAGRIFQHGGTAGPVDIYNGQISGEAIMFKANAPVVSTVKKIVTFTGRLNGTELAFTRDVEVIATGPEPASGENGMFSTTGPKQFLAKKAGPAVLPLVTIEPMKAEAPPVNVTGRWESERMTFDRWSIDLKADGATVTGTVTVAPGPERQNMVDRNPRPIFDGRIEGNTLSFKLNSFDGVRTVHITGKVQGEEIAFNRTVQVNNINVQRAFGVEDIYGTSASFAWVGRRRHTLSAAEQKLKQEMEANRFKWTGRSIKTYEFTVLFDCGPCWLPSTPMTFRVNGTTGTPVVTSATPVSSDTPGARAGAGAVGGGARGNPGRGAAAPAGAPASPIGRFSTMDKFMDLVNELLQLQPYSAKVSFDPTFGFVTSAELLSGLAIDDDVRIKVTDFKILD